MLSSTKVVQKSVLISTALRTMTPDRLNLCIDLEPFNIQCLGCSCHSMLHFNALALKYIL